MNAPINSSSPPASSISTEASVVPASRPARAEPAEPEPITM